MRPIFLVPFIGFTFGLFLVPTRGQLPAGKPTTKLPLTKVVLYNAGIGYFHRSGNITGPTAVELKVDREDVNDLLKTLIAEDSTGTPPRSVTFDHHASNDVALRAFALDLAVNPTIGNLLHQARGEKVTITEKDGANSSGLIVSVEKPTPEVIPYSSSHPASEDAAVMKTKVVAPPVDAVERVNLLADDGLQSIPLKSIKKVKFLKPELEAEFRKALEKLASSRMEGKKTVAVEFSGGGQRDVKVGYVAEAPLWKPNYRMSLTANVGKMQAWATVENSTDEDWSNVDVTLASGRPMTFQMDLYEPLYLPRPMVEPEAFASLRPPVYAAGQFGQLGGIGGGIGGIGGFGGGFGGGMPNTKGGQNQGIGGGAFGIQGGLTGQFGIQGGSAYTIRPGIRSLSGDRLSYAEFIDRMKNKAAEKNAIHAGIGGGLISANTEISLGESAEYKIAEQVSLPRYKTALLPFHTGAVDVERVSIYNASTLANNPLLGLRVKNNTGLFLPAGPIAIYDNGSFAGEARLADFKKDQTRLISFAIDLLTTIRQSEYDFKTINEDFVIENGQLHSSLERRYSLSYVIRSAATAERFVLIEHPVTPQRSLVSPEKPEERTKDAYRFRVTAKPNQTVKLEVIEQEKVEIKDELNSIADSNIQDAIAKSKRPAVKAVLEKLAAMKAALSLTAKEIGIEQNALKQIDIDQSRLRANIEKVPRDSDAYKRYLKKFDEQETEIESRRKKVLELTAAAEAKQTELNAFTKSANAK